MPRHSDPGSLLTNPTDSQMTYKQAGVDTEAGAELVKRIKNAAASAGSMC